MTQPRSTPSNHGVATAYHAGGARDEPGAQPACPALSRSRIVRDTLFRDDHLPTPSITDYEPGTRAHASLALYHTSAPASDAIALLGQSDRSHNAGDLRVTRNGIDSFYKHSYWSYRSEGECHATSLDDHLRWLADRFPDPTPFTHLHANGWTVTAWSYLPTFGNDMHDLAPGTLAWLASIHANLMLDIYSFADDGPGSLAAVMNANPSADT